jgi:uncharacterized protein (DUF433 family)
MTVPKGLEGGLKINSEVMHGALCFSGTRIPLCVFLDNLKEGMTVNEFLTDYSTITREQVNAVLAWEDRAIRQATGPQLAGF